jgi:hypothetical protein
VRHCETCTCDQQAPTRELSAVRIAGRAAFAKFLHDYFVRHHLRGASLVPAWAARWGVSETTVRQWANTLKTRAVVAAGDLDALEPADLLALLEAWAERVRTTLAPVAPATDPRSLALSLAVSIGDAAKVARKAMADGRCVRVEWEAVEAQFAAIEAEAREAKLAARAAGERAR